MWFYSVNDSLYNKLILTGELTFDNTTEIEVGDKIRFLEKVDNECTNRSVICQATLKSRKEAEGMFTYNVQVLDFNGEKS